MIYLTQSGDPQSQVKDFYLTVYLNASILNPILVYSFPQVTHYQLPPPLHFIVPCISTEPTRL